MAKKFKNKSLSDKPFTVSYPVVVGIVFWLLFILGIWQAGHIIYRSNAFVVKNITCNMKADKKLVAGIVGSPLFSVDTSALRNKFLLSDSDFRDVIVEKKFPSTLSIVIDKRKAFVQIKYNGFYTIDKYGIVLDDDPDQDMNLLCVEVSDCPKQPHKGVDVNSEQLYLARKMIKELNNKKIFNRYRVSAVNVASSKSEYFMLRSRFKEMNDVQVIMGDDDFSRKLFILDNLLTTKIKGDLPLVKYIDLRYKKAYVGYKQ